MVDKVKDVKATVDELAIFAVNRADLGVCDFDVAKADVSCVHSACFLKFVY